MVTEVYVASMSDGCPMTGLDGLKIAREVNKFAADEGRDTSVEELDRVLRETVCREDLLLYGLGVYCREVSESDSDDGDDDEDDFIP